MSRLAMFALAVILHSSVFILNCFAQVITTVAGGTWIFRGAGKRATDTPLGGLGNVAVDSAGSVFAADAFGSVVVKISSAGVLTVVAGNGFFGFSGDGGPATSASLGAFGLALDAFGNLYISGDGRVRKVSAGGTITTVAGTGAPGFSGDGGLATSAQLNRPGGLAVDGAGNLYVVDSANARIRRVNPSGIITTVAGNGSAGFSGDGGPASSASLSLPSIPQAPSSVALDASGNLYIADTVNGRIRKVNTSGIISTVAGGGTNFPGDGGPATSAFLDRPAGVMVDAVGNLYIGEVARVRKVSASGIITTVAGNGNRGFSGDGGPASSASLSHATGLALDAAGNLYIGDISTGRVRKVDSRGIIMTVAGNGLFSFGGDGGPATSAFLNGPQAAAVDDTGNLYIADFFNRRVRRVNAGGIIATVAGNGNLGFSGDGGPATGSRLASPNSIAPDAAATFISPILKTLASAR